MSFMTFGRMRKTSQGRVKLARVARDCQGASEHLHGIFDTFTPRWEIRGFLSVFFLLLVECLDGPVGDPLLSE
jgi:hypothetical protein